MLSDTHGSIGHIPPAELESADAILLCGDIGSSDIMRRIFFERFEARRAGREYPEPPRELVKEGYLESVESAAAILAELSEKAPIYLVAGNVERNDEQTLAAVGLGQPSLQERLGKIGNIHFLDSSVEMVGGLQIAGLGFYLDSAWLAEFSPAELPEKGGRAALETQAARGFLSKLGKVDIVLSHLPPLGILDEVAAETAPAAWRGKHAGSGLLLEYIKRAQPGLVLCGHIHEAAGEAELGRTKVVNIGFRGWRSFEL